MESGDGSSDESDQWVAQLLNAELPENSRLEIRDKLHKFILVLAAETASHPQFDAILGGEFIEHGVSHVFANLTNFRPGKGRFRNWAKAVLRNLAIDHRRYQLRRSPRIIFLSDGIADEEHRLKRHPEAEQQSSKHDSVLLDNRVQEIRDVLSDLGQRRRGGINYPAVFQLDLRIRFWLCIQKVLPETSASDAQLLVERYFPWETQEAEQHLTDDWPPLSDLWIMLTSDLLPELTIQGVIERLQVAGVCPENFSASVWATWTRRARQLVRSQIGEHNWHKIFQGFWS